MQFLLIEDDEALIELLTTVLNTQNHGLVVARDGVAGKVMAESQFYDLILLDVGLPKLDGITLCRQLRQQGNLVPIILLTVRNSNTDNLIGLEAGADDYVVKPFNLNILMARIRALLRREYRSFRWEKPASHNLENTFSTELTRIWERTKNTTFSRIQDLLDVLQSLEKGELDNTARERTKRNVHKLAGSLGTFGFQEGSTISQKLEQIFME
ncbi:MAG: response regulator, partial [Prochlorotrichaceae cyanobacterium]